jgi:hypothetical protein
MRVRTSCLLLASFACSSPQPDRTPDSVASVGRTAAEPVARRFLLARIGREPVDRKAAATRCEQRPFYSRYELGDLSWTAVDSMFWPCGAPSDRKVVAQPSGGRLVLRGDTLDFFVTDTTIGVKGLVGSGILRTDTLILWNSDLDGGNYTYVRVP